MMVATLEYGKLLLVTSLVINDQLLQGTALLLCDYTRGKQPEVINIIVVILLPQ